MSRAALATFILLLLPLAGCLEAGPTPTDNGMAWEGAEEKGTLLVVALDRYWVNDTEGAPRGMGPGPWCAPAEYERDPPSLHLNQREDEPVPRATLVRNFGDEEGAWEHGQFLRHDFGHDLQEIPAAASESIAPVEIRIDAEDTDAVLVGLTNATALRGHRLLEPGETKELRIEYEAEGGGRTTEILTITNLGRVSPTVGVRPCD